ncbi:gp308 [Bacillus phage G]|uniref:Gp308 n=1 Tax=Bacillus phage G TaxID=2884420 RepID=G3MA49_9CAUD|nr:gp308 [Bacillus phage G]AEO93567.1 gp308 [Bacillus phage G]
MDLKLLSKERTRELEHTTEPIENFTMYNERFKSQYFHKQYFRINSWFRVNGLTTNNTQGKFNEKLSELLGYKPLYYQQYEYKTAVWGFEWKSEEFIMYRSERGLSIQIGKKFNKTKLEDFFDELTTLLKVNGIETPYD